MVNLKAFGFAAATAVSVCMAPLVANAATVNDTIDFSSGVLTGGGIKTYIEDGYQFYDARIVGGPCEIAGADNCAALNINEITVLTRVDGGVFSLTSLWFYLNGKANDLTNALAVYDTNNTAHRFNFTQALFGNNGGHTVTLDFTGVSSITFSSSDGGNARFDTARLSHMAAVPLPASGLMLIGAFGGVAALRRRKSI